MTYHRFKSKNPGQEGLLAPHGKRTLVNFIESTFYQDVVVSFCRGEAIPCLDLLPTFRSADRSGVPLHFKRGGHWNQNGHRLAAETIHAFLLSANYVQ